MNISQFHIHVKWDMFKDFSLEDRREVRWSWTLMNFEAFKEKQKEAVQYSAYEQFCKSLGPQRESKRSWFAFAGWRNYSLFYWRVWVSRNTAGIWIHVIFYIVYIIYNYVFVIYVQLHSCLYITTYIYISYISN